MKMSQIYFSQYRNKTDTIFLHIHVGRTYFSFNNNRNLHTC